MSNIFAPSWLARFLVWLVAGVSLLLSLGGLCIGMVVSHLMQVNSQLSSAINTPFILTTSVIFALSAGFIVLTRRDARPAGE